MKIKFTVIIAFFFIAYSYSQQISDGYAPAIPDFTIPLKSGVYNGSSPIGITPDNSNPWQHLFVIRHLEPNNNHQLQLASSITVNDRLFFRKIADYGLNPQNTSWLEVATRGTNNFSGNQSINGKLGIGTINPSNKLSIVDNSENQFMASFVGGKVYENYRYAAISYGEATLSGSSANIGYMSHTSNKSLSGLYFTNYGESEKLSSLFIKSGGNVGIGTINPDSKLAVNGTTHSKEVKVDMSGWSDFVFKKEYNLPTLAEVEKHINEKGHLENIPSEEEVLENGINLGEMNAKLLQKIEELTLYSIQQNKKIELQNKEIESLKELVLRVAKIENELSQK